MAAVLHSIRHWLRRLVHRPADLLEFFSGLWTAVWVAMAYLRHSGVSVPSIEVLARLQSADWWLACAFLAAVLQLVALSMRDWHLLRFVAAALVGWWYAALMLAAYQKLGGHQTLALYGLVASMNGYILLHVLDGRRR